jgi:hypothetical protein
MVSDCFQIDPVDYRGIEPYMKVYVITSQLPGFLEEILPSIDVPIVLVTGDSEFSVPKVFSYKKSGRPFFFFPSTKILQTFNRLVENPLIVRWFAQNNEIHNKKIVSIPIGLDYHTLHENDYHPWAPGSTRRSPLEQEAELKQIIENMPDLRDRPLRICCNFHFILPYVKQYWHKDRKFALKVLKDKPFAIFSEKFIPRLELWKSYQEFSFVASPHGYGLDCHRTWEALILGCIPIVRTSPLDVLYKNLPVLIVKEWSDITFELLELFKEAMKDQDYNFEKLKLSYWVNLLKCSVRI